MSQEVCDNDVCAWTQFLQIQKYQISDLEESLEPYCNFFICAWFQWCKISPNLIKSRLLPIPLNEQDIEPIVIKKTNLFVSFNFDDNQLLVTKSFLGGAKSLDSFLKAYSTSETKTVCPMNGLITLKKCRIPNPPYEKFYSKLRNWNLLESQHMDFASFLGVWLTTEQAVIKLKPSKPTPTGIENYHYLQQR